jgi:hypothetical protein
MTEIIFKKYPGINNFFRGKDAKEAFLKRYSYSEAAFPVSFTPPKLSENVVDIPSNSKQN